MTTKRGVLAAALALACGAASALTADDTSNQAASMPRNAPAPAGIEWVSTDQPVRRLVEKGLPNFGKLNAAVWRSGQPKREGYARLKEMGVRSIVNLRKEFPEERELVERQLGSDRVKYFFIPMADETAPTDEQAEEFLRIVADPDNWPVLVHCHGGEGRAGVMAALVRFAFDGWDDARIMKEVNNFRIVHLGLFKTRMIASQRHFLKEWQEKHLRGGLASKIGPMASRAASTN